MRPLRIHRGKHYRRRTPAFSLRRFLLHLLDWTASCCGRHGRLMMRLRVRLNRNRI